MRDMSLRTLLYNAISLLFIPNLPLCSEILLRHSFMSPDLHLFLNRLLVLSKLNCDMAPLSELSPWGLEMFDTSANYTLSIVDSKLSNLPPVASIILGLYNPTEFFFTFDPPENCSSECSYLIREGFPAIKPYLEIPETFCTLNAGASTDLEVPFNDKPRNGGLYRFPQLSCLESKCSNQALCEAVFDCMRQSFLLGNGSIVTSDNFYTCYTSIYPNYQAPRFRCELLIVSIDKFSAFTNPCQYANLNGQPVNDLFSWEYFMVEKNIQTLISGGLDTVGIYWLGREPGQTFAQALGSSLYENINFRLQSRRAVRLSVQL